MTANRQLQTLPQRLAKWASRDDHVDVALVLSVLAIIPASIHDRYVLVAVGIWAIPMIGERSWRHHPAPWLIAAGGLAWWQVPLWFEFDNHTWFTTYWTTAVGLCLALGRNSSRDWLMRNGRLLIGLIFALAVAWKVSSTTYLTGEFFTYQMLIDPRFAPVAEWIGGIDPSDLENNRAVLTLLTSDPSGPAVQLTSNDRIHALALVFSWWGLLIELLVAVTWLAPLRGWAWLRHATLIAFMVTTYVVVPVVGFGCLLMAMAMTQPNLPRWARLTYLIGFFVLVAYGGLFVAVLMS